MSTLKFNLIGIGNVYLPMHERKRCSRNEQNYEYNLHENIRQVANNKKMTTNRVDIFSETRFLFKFITVREIKQRTKKWQR